MIKIIKIIKVLTDQEKLKSFLIVIQLIVASILEVFTLAILLSFLYILLNSPLEILEKYNFLFFEYIKNLFSNNSIVILLIFLFIFYLIKNLLLFIFNYNVIKFCENISLRVSNKIFKNHLNSDYLLLTKKNSNNLFYKNTESVGQFTETLINLILIVSESVTVFLLLLFLVYFHTSSLLLALISIIPFAYLLNFFFKKKILKLSVDYQFYENQRIKTIYESLAAIKEIKVFKKINFFVQKFLFQNYERTKIRIYERSFKLLPRLTIEIVFVLTIILIIFYLTYRNISNSEILIIISMYALASLRLMPSINRILSSLQSFNFYSSSIFAVLTEINIRKSKIDVKNKYSKLIKNDGVLVFNNVSFKYRSSKKYILKNINFSILKNEFIGIFGETGAGKTTLLNLILELINPNRGKILRNYKNLSFVPQSPLILDDSLIKNVAFGVDVNQINIEKVKKSLKDTRLSSFVEKIYNKTLLNVGERGSLLSGGQLQRLGIARALYFDSDIIVLDEVTNALDHKTERLVLKNLRNLKSKSTIIMVSHNKNLMKYCDRVFQVVNNKVKIFD